MKTRIIIAALAVLALCGCTTIKYKSGDVEVSATSLLNKRSISKARFDPKTGELQLEGYSSEQAEQSAAIAAAIAGALAK
jgi:predicted aminopeptidase